MSKRMVSPLHELWYVLPNQNFDWRTLYKETLERLLVTLQIWLLGFAWIHDCHNCLLVLQVAGVFWVAKKVSIFNSSILPSYFSSCSSLSATQDCWFNQFPGQQYFAQWELQLMILFWMNMNLFKRKQYIVFCIEKSIVKHGHIYIFTCYNSQYAKDYLFVHIEGLDTLMMANECLYFCSIGF